MTVVAVGERHLVVDPLPDLCPADLGGGGVLHQVVDRRSTGAAEPRGDVAQPDRDVGVEPGAASPHRAGRDGEQLAGGHLDVVAQAIELVRAVTQDGVELGERRRDEVRVRHPGAVEAVARLAALVLGDLGEGALGDVGLAPVRDESRHPADGVGTAAVTGAHEQVAVGAHERARSSSPDARSGSTKAGSARKRLAMLKM